MLYYCRFTMKRSPFSALLVLVVLSGCLSGIPGLSGENYWQVGIGGELAPEEGGYVFEGSVGLSGNYGPVEVSGLRIEFVDADNNTMTSVPIGTLNQSRPQATFNAIVEAPPELVIPVADRIDSPSNMEYAITGLRRTGNGDYDEFTRKTSRAGGLLDS